MGIEIERKFLVNHTLWDLIPKQDGIKIVQGFLVNGPEKVVRVRIKGDKGFITIKSCHPGLIRNEFEYEIPLQDAGQLLELFIGEKISKTRYKIIIDGHTWEIDEFHEDNKGLILAEIELNDELESFTLPEWVEAEVTHDERYYNAYLSEFPFTGWEK